ncbi:hypothetical protein TrCOL_g12868 [Triparma columacea]|uniref:NLE domain-containing protein n=1 Tax=Triparma columacea TaxID=722753 RepID=A0A9W7FZ31_9STRA|nr:hypothetical protein TrCOL_g12868 [Triparma columacea]
MSGVTWGGSLAGVTNPDVKLGYNAPRNGPDGKPIPTPDSSLPSSVMVQLVSSTGSTTFPPIDVPINSTTTQLEALVHNLLNPDSDDDSDDDDDEVEKKKKKKKRKVESTPYAFYLSPHINPSGTTSTPEDKELTTSLLDAIKSFNSLATSTSSPPIVSTEKTLTVTFQPLAVYKVRPVTRCTDTMPGHTEAVLHVQYSPSGRHLASGGGDTTVRFWDTNTALPKFTCTGHRNHVLTVSWSPCGTHFASGDKSGTLIIWDPSTGASKFTYKAHSKWITGISWEPMHRNEGKGERIATSSKDGLVKVFNVRLQRVLFTLSGHTDSVEAIRWGGEGLIYTASRDRTIKVWGAEDIEGTKAGKLVRTLTGHGHRVNTLALSCDYTCRTGPFDHNGLNDGSADAMFARAKSKYTEIISQAPERLVSGSDDFTLFFWHPTTSKQPVKRLTGHQQAVNCISFSPSGRHFASASFDKKVKIWDGRNGNFLHTLTGHVGAVYCVAWSSDGRYVVSASKDSTVKLWEVGETKAKETLPGHADEVYALDWSPNGRSVASGSKDRTIKIWKH